MINKAAYRLTLGSADFVCGAAKYWELIAKNPPQKKGHPSRVAKREDRKEGEPVGTCTSKLPAVLWGCCRTNPVQRMWVIIRRLSRAVKSTLTMLVIGNACVALKRAWQRLGVNCTRTVRSSLLMYPTD
jgi:hypothetical protein